VALAKTLKQNANGFKGFFISLMADAQSIGEINNSCSISLLKVNFAFIGKGHYGIRRDWQKGSGS
jgi:hypothetical protein